MNGTSEAFECVAYRGTVGNVLKSPSLQYVARSVEYRDISEHGGTLREAMGNLDSFIDQVGENPQHVSRKNSAIQRMALRLRVALDAITYGLRPTEHASWRHTPAKPPRG